MSGMVDGINSVLSDLRTAK